MTIPSQPNLVEVSGLYHVEWICRNEGVGGEVIDDRLEGERKELGLAELEIKALQF